MLEDTDFLGNDRAVKLVLVGGVILISLGIFLFYIDVYTILELFTSWTARNQGILSLLVSLILAVVYFGLYRLQKIQNKTQQKQTEILERQSKIQNRQAEIMQQQENWMEIRHTPQLSVNSWQVDGDTVEIEISNFGNGPAEQLMLKIELRQMQSTFTDQMSKGNGIRIIPPKDLPEKYEVDPVTILLFRNDRIDTNDQGREVRTLPPEETLRFRNNSETSVWIENENREHRSLSFGHYLREISKYGVKQIHYNIGIHFEYANENMKKLNIFGGYITLNDIDFEEIITLENLLKSTNIPHHPKSGVEPDLVEYGSIVDFTPPEKN